MPPEFILQIFADGFFLVAVIVFVIIMPSLCVGLIVSIFQAATQINEQTLSFLPRLMTTLMTILIAGPWILRSIIDFTHRMAEAITMMVV